jgi:hypothetical protein
VNGSRLRTVLESVYGRQLPLAAQWICRITMRITDARNLPIIPLDHSIQQAHQIGVGDQCANFRFCD